MPRLNTSVRPFALSPRAPPSFLSFGRMEATAESFKGPHARVQALHILINTFLNISVQ